MTTIPTSRKSAGERREEILEAAMIEFAEKGLYGTSTDDIARRVGVSQPYLFRLFGTKKELFIAAVERCLEQTLALFRTAAGGRSARRRSTRSDRPTATVWSIIRRLSGSR